MKRLAAVVLAVLLFFPVEAAAWHPTKPERPTNAEVILDWWQTHHPRRLIDPCGIYPFPCRSPR